MTVSSSKRHRIDTNTTTTQSSSKNEKPNLLTVLSLQDFFFSIFRFLLPKELAEQPNIKDAFLNLVGRLKTSQDKIENLPTLYFTISVFHRVVLVNRQANFSVNFFMGWDKEKPKEKVQPVFNELQLKKPHELLVQATTEMQPRFVDFMFTTLFKDAMIDVVCNHLSYKLLIPKPLVFSCSLLSDSKYEADRVISIAIIILKNITLYYDRENLKWDECAECLMFGFNDSFLSELYRHKKLIQFLEMINSTFSTEKKATLCFILASRKHIEPFIKFINSLLTRGDLEALKAIKACFPAIYEMLHRAFKFDLNHPTYGSSGSLVYFDPLDTMLTRGRSAELDLCGEFLVLSGVSTNDPNIIAQLEDAGFVKTAAALSEHLLI